MQKWSVWVVLLVRGWGVPRAPANRVLLFETRSGAVVCEPYIEVFPVNGPVNVGYDLSLSDALVYGCPDAPDETYANTDFGGIITALMCSQPWVLQWSRRSPGQSSKLIQRKAEQTGRWKRGQDQGNAVGIITSLIGRD